jgi:5-methylcytosine-specific restriction enzyme A
VKPCLACGEPGTNSRCADHQLDHGLTAHQRGYDSRWRKLSARARKLQPWCDDCGDIDDLTADHSPEAWARHDAGKPIRLRDITVVCRACNTLRGKARGRTPKTAGQRPRGKAQGALYTPGGIR